MTDLGFRVQSSEEGAVGTAEFGFLPLFTAPFPKEYHHVPMDYIVTCAVSDYFSHSSS